ncbi:hypothetical protein, partial [Shewanella frigidimarina]|uniref:hypothetical protein n=1 Tax=Shewanella frigidimarina TaxID=56812 RepID=UPI003FA0F678
YDASGCRNGSIKTPPVCVQFYLTTSIRENVAGRLGQFFKRVKREQPLVFSWSGVGEAPRH